MHAALRWMENLPYRAVALLVPALAALACVIILFATLPPFLLLPMLGLIASYLLPPAGKETVIPVGIALGIPWWYMASVIVAVDAVAGLFMVLNFDLVERIPWAGHHLAALTKTTRQYIADHPWFARLSFFAVVLMVMVPVFGSGGIRGSVAGKLLGLGTLPTFIAILSGSFLGCFSIALGFDAFLSWICTNSTFQPGIAGWVCGT